MSSGNSSSGSRSERSMPSNDAPRFAFVSENNQADARSHAMREHWRQRHSRNNSGKAKRIQPKLLPSPAYPADRIQKPRDLPSRDRSTRSHGSQSSSTKHSEATSSEIEPGRYSRETALGITPQLLNGMSHALSTARLDPFQQFPVELTPQHHKLLHHWIGTHATMMFEDLDIPTFNPMKDVWFPLDLSNASSFNAIMAHSAAHLAQLYAGTSSQRASNSSAALTFKAEAVRILHEWLSEPEKALSSDAFAAVIRLLTFERYWGTAEEWNIHRTGLHKMIEAKGGIGELHDNWRLELVVYLVSLMSRPSWFESTNNISEISEPSSNAFSLDPNMDIQKIRCLWLISFIQDMRTFMGFSSRFYVHGLSAYPSLYDAVTLLRTDFQAYPTNKSPSGGPEMTVSDYNRLTCLFSICIMMQDLISSPLGGPIGSPSPSHGLVMLDDALANSRALWQDSVSNLRPFLLHHLVECHLDGPQKIDYIGRMVEVLSHLSLEAGIGVEKCLLNMLCRTQAVQSTFLVDDGWTPDSLLSSMHGQ